VHKAPPAPQGETAQQVAVQRGHTAAAELLARAPEGATGNWGPVDDPDYMPASSNWGQARRSTAAFDMQARGRGTRHTPTLG
jgi:hypothetical protein